VSIFLPLYLKISKRKFQRQFKPLGAKKKLWHLVSVPHNAKDFFTAYPFLIGLSKIGSVVLLMPKLLEHIRSFMKPRQFEIIMYEKTPGVFSEDYKRVALQLGDRYFHFLIELNTPANFSLPYLSNFQRRISFYDVKNFPYYNIQMKHGYASLNEFFNIETENVSDMFHFSGRDLKTIERKLDKSRPLLFVNGGDEVKWKGGKVILGQDIMPNDQQVWSALFIADAYYGTQDAFYEFARINNKKILNE